MISLTNKQQRDLLIAIGLGDFLVGGKITAVTKKAVSGALKRIIPAAGRAAPRIGATAWLVARRHPVVAVGSLIAAGIIYPEERDQVIRDIQEGAQYTRELVEELERRTEPGRRGVGRATRRAAEFFMETGERQPRHLGGYGLPDYSGGRSFGVLPTQTTKKRPSTFNKAVSAGMKAVKKSTSYGGKGKIKPAKKVFSLVTKIAAAKKKKKKAPKSGIRRTIWNAMRGY